jgi:class 3 adenylate cyclase
MDEFSERAGQAYAARTRDDLAVLVADLPPGTGPRPAGPPASGLVRAAVPRGVPVAADQGTPQRTKRVVAIMSPGTVKGRWRPPAKVAAFAWWGAAKVDLRDAEITTPVVEVTAWAAMGSVTVVVPEDVAVDIQGMVVMGATTDQARTTVNPSEARALVRVKARGFWGSVNVRTPRRRRSRSRSSDAAGASSVDGAVADDGVDDGFDDAATDRGERSGRSRDGAWGHGMGHGHGHRRRGGPRPPVVPPLPALPQVDLDDLIPPILNRNRRPQPAEARRPAPAPPPAAPPAAPPPSPPGPADAGADGDADAPTRVRPTGRVLTMLVSDICDSTTTAVRLGDQRWMTVLASHNALVREQVRRYHGTEVKAQGDGFIVTFTSARQAVLAAIAIQRALAAHRRTADDGVHVRIGIHTGEVVEEDGDIFGQNVVVAVRIADVAGPDEVLVSGLTRDLTEASGDLAFDGGRDVELKGIARPSRVHGTSWE